MTSYQDPGRICREAQDSSAVTGCSEGFTKIIIYSPAHDHLRGPPVNGFHAGACAHARDFNTASEWICRMDTSLVTNGQRQQWHVGKINGAGAPAAQLRYASNYALAVLARCDRDRPEDASGLRRFLARMIGEFAIEAPWSRLEQPYRETFPPLPINGRIRSPLWIAERRKP